MLQSSQFNNAPQIAKLYIHKIAISLTGIINCSAITDTVPKSLKIAKAAPIFKSEENKSIDNYTHVNPVILL